MQNLIAHLNFIRECDKLKTTLRKTKLICTDRYENDAEHSWHLALMAMVLKDYANTPIDLLKVIKMVIIHDLGEIGTGDVMVYHKTAADDEAEKVSVQAFFNTLPEPLATELMTLWLEFSDRKTPEAKFAAALDRLEPVLQNINRNGGSWRENKIPYDKVIAINGKIADGSQEIWNHVKAEIDQIEFDL